MGRGVMVVVGGPPEKKELCVILIWSHYNCGKNDTIQIIQCTYIFMCGYFNNIFVWFCLCYIIQVLLLYHLKNAITKFFITSQRNGILEIMILNSLMGSYCFMESLTKRIILQMPCQTILKDLDPPCRLRWMPFIGSLDLILL